MFSDQETVHMYMENIFTFLINYIFLKAVQLFYFESTI